jgi:hypothetical protein
VKAYSHFVAAPHGVWRQRTIDIVGDLFVEDRQRRW